MRSSSSSFLLFLTLSLLFSSYGSSRAPSIVSVVMSRRGSNSIGSNSLEMIVNSRKNNDRISRKDDNNHLNVIISSKANNNQETENSREPKRSTKYFIDCSLAGAISCSLSHALMVPIDNLKTKMQVSDVLASMRTREALSHLVKVDGWKALTKGLSE